jgi:hypothetical protein
MNESNFVSAIAVETINLEKGALQKEQTGAVVLSLFTYIILATHLTQYS